jgi:glycosyltransferase involved in cell wall biosynthesis
MYRLFQALSRQRFDLVHSHGYFADTIAAPATRLLGIPHVATCHGYINTSIALKIYNRLDLAALANCQKIIAVSNGIQQYLVQRGLNPFKIDVIPNAVPTFSTQWLNAQRTKARSALAIHDQQFVMGYVGRLSIEKGIHHLIEALSIVRSQSNNSFHLFIIGDGPERSRLQEMSKKYSLNQHITFTGFQQEVSRYLNALDILVLPSLTEGTPMALLEAMSLGVPTVATRVGGVPDIVSDGVDGFLVRPGNAGHLAERILSLLESPESLKHASSSAKMKIQQHYDVEHWCRRIEHLYSRTCHPQSLRPCVHPGCNPTDS